MVPRPETPSDVPSDCRYTIRSAVDTQMLRRDGSTGAHLATGHAPALRGLDGQRCADDELAAPVSGLGAPHGGPWADGIGEHEGYTVVLQVF